MDRIGTRTVDKLLICPYNPAHRVERGPRYQRHLIECAKDHKHVEEVICRFNHTHRIKAPDAMHHMMTCPDKFIVEKQIIQMDDKNEMRFKDKLANEETVLPPSTENWDDDLLAEPMAIPSIHNNKNIKFFNSDTLSGLKPSQKKKFRQNLWKGKNTWLDEDGEGEENGEKEPAPMTQPSQQPMRLPIRQPKAAQLAPELEKLHIGRGMSRLHANVSAPSRIAANIFGRVEPLPQEQAMQYGLAGIGRGMPLTLSKAAACSSSRPTTASSSAIPAMTPPSPASLPMPGLFPAPQTNGLAFQTASEQFEDALPPTKIRSPPGFSSSSRPCPPGVADNNAATAIPNDESCIDEGQKLKKKLEKKLKQIERLEERQVNGETLNPDELEKLELKSALLKELGM